MKSNLVKLSINGERTDQEGKEEKINEKQQMIENLSIDMKIMIIKAALKTEFTTALKCVFENDITLINSYEITDKIFDNINYSAFVGISIKANTFVIKKIIISELYRLGVLLSVKTGKDYAQKINQTIISFDEKCKQILSMIY